MTVRVDPITGLPVIQPTVVVNGGGGSGNSGDMTKTTYDPASVNEQLVGLTATQTLTNKTISAPQLTGTSKIQSTGTLELYNTADQTTNYEKFVARYNSNVLELAGLYGGTSTSRILRWGSAITAGGGIFRYFEVNPISTPILSMQWGSTGVGTSTTPIVSVGSASTLISSTVVQSAFGVTPTVNQSGTGGYTALLVNPTETATGSGSKLLADFQVGGVSKAKIDNTGVITSAAGTSSGNVATIDGTQTLTNKTLTTPKIDVIKDATQGLNTLAIYAPASAVNYIQALASVTGNNVGIYAQGSDTNIGISLNTKGTGKLYTGGVEVATISSTQTLTNKTIQAPQLTGTSQIADGANIAVGSTTGTKIGSATTQKLGFWNATPIVQPTTAGAAATFVANTSGIADDTATFDGYTIGQVVKALRNAGLLA